MLKRFQGNDGRARLIRVLCTHTAIANNHAFAEQVADTCALREFAAGTPLIKQGATDNSMFLILMGTCEVLVNGRIVAERGPGRHVGELAALDPSASRSATVRAVDRVVAATLSDIDVAALGEQFPELYRCFAVELAQRLRERGDHVKAPNGVPRVFVGSSVEGLDVVHNLQRGLQHDTMDVVVWTDNVVEPGQHVCDALLAQVRCSDFAVFHTSADDSTWSRKKLFDSPRDNVVFELGMFMGVLSRERCFLLAPRAMPLKIPSDLLGITTLTYEVPSDSSLLQSKLGPAIQSVRDAVRRLGTV